MLTTWCLVIGLLLIGMGLTDTMRRGLPFSSAGLYLLAGWLIGPQMAGLLHLDVFADARLLEVLTEAAVLISLFAVGLRLRVRLTDRLWLTPLLLASVAMLLTIAALAAVGVGLGLSLGATLLLAAVLAPTDPVLASEVQVENPGDRDALRFSLSGEGGLNVVAWRHWRRSSPGRRRGVGDDRRVGPAARCISHAGDAPVPPCTRTARRRVTSPPPCHRSRSLRACSCAASSRR